MQYIAQQLIGDHSISAFLDDFRSGKYDTIQCSKGLARSPGGCDRLDRCYQWHGDVGRYVSIIKKTWDNELTLVQHF